MRSIDFGLPSQIRSSTKKWTWLAIYEPFQTLVPFSFLRGSCRSNSELEKYGKGRWTHLLSHSYFHTQWFLLVLRIQVSSIDRAFPCDPYVCPRLNIAKNTSVSIYSSVRIHRGWSSAREGESLSSSSIHFFRLLPLLLSTAVHIAAFTCQNLFHHMLAGILNSWLILLQNYMLCYLIGWSCAPICIARSVVYVNRCI